MSAPRAVKWIKIITHDPERTQYKLQDGEHFLQTLLDDKATPALIADMDMLIFDLQEDADNHSSGNKVPYDKANIVKGCEQIAKLLSPNKPFVVKLFAADHNDWKDSLGGNSLLAPERSTMANNIVWVAKDKLPETFTLLRDKLSEFTGASEAAKKEKERIWKIAVFKQLYCIMRDSETAWYQSFFKTNALPDMAKMTDEQAETFINNKSQTSRTRKAWELTNNYLNVFTQAANNHELLTELYQHSFRNSGWFSKACNVVTNKGNTREHVTFWKSSSLDAALEAKTVSIYPALSSNDSRLGKLKWALETAINAARSDAAQKEQRAVSAMAASPAARR